MMVGLVSAALLAGFLFARYGNERMDYMTAAEFEAVDYLYEVAEPGALWLSAASNLPWRYQQIETYTYAPLSAEVIDDVDRFAELMAEPRYPAAYLILSRGQKAYAELYAGWPPGAFRWSTPLVDCSP